MSDLARVGLSLPSIRRATTPDTHDSPICPVPGPETAYTVTLRPVLDGFEPTGRLPLHISRPMFEDPANFSYEAVGLYMELISYPIGTRFTLPQLAAMSPKDTLEDTAAALDELVAAGYVEVAK